MTTHDSPDNYHQCQADQFMRAAFDLAVSFAFLLDATQLEGSGLPAEVLQAHPAMLPILLDAEFHAYNEPRFDAHGFSLTLSFDALYRCSFPWSAVQQMTVFPVPPEVAEAEDKPKPMPSDASHRGHLRLVPSP